jgi:peptide/nickel transport system permease protein
MLVYVVRRLLLAAFVFVAVSFLSFVLLAAPLDPLAKKYGPYQGPKREADRQRLHLDEPAVKRYWLWVKGTVTGTPGFVTRQVCGGRLNACHESRIWPQVWSATKRTALLAALAVVVIVLLSLVIGTIAAVRPGSVVDGVVRTGSYLAWSIPAFALAVLLQLLFTRLQYNYDFKPFAISGLPFPGEAGTGFHFIQVWAQHLTLPVLVIAAGFVGSYSRYVRSAMLVALNEQYAVTARAKGLTERRVVVRHALRNSLVPFVSLLTLEFGALFGATLVADYVFRQEGLAAFLGQMVYDGDPFEAQALVLVGAASVLIFSLLGDLLTSRLDPRIRLAD